MVKEKGEPEKWGVLVERRVVPRHPAARPRTVIKDHIKYRLKLVPYKGQGSFVTNAAVRKVIKEKGWAKGVKQLGWIKLELNHSMPKWIVIQDFQPFEKLWQGKNYLPGLGLASLIEFEVIKDVIKLFGSRRAALYKYKVGWIDPVSGARRRQFEKRGLKMGDSVPLLEYKALLLKQIQAGVKKERAKAKPKPKKAEKKKPKPRRRK
jgi:hypothetical protein